MPNATENHGFLPFDIGWHARPELLPPAPPRALPLPHAFG